MHSRLAGQTVAEKLKLETMKLSNGNEGAYVKNYDAALVLLLRAGDKLKGVCGRA